MERGLWRPTDWLGGVEYDQDSLFPEGHLLSSLCYLQPDLPRMMIDWNAVDTVFLDLDGTLLDRHFDNYF